MAGLRVRMRARARVQVRQHTAAVALWPQTPPHASATEAEGAGAVCRADAPMASAPPPSAATRAWQGARVADGVRGLVGGGGQGGN